MNKFKNIIVIYEDGETSDLKICILLSDVISNRGFRTNIFDHLDSVKNAI